MRGRFTHGANAEEWCARRLLARIHAYTIKRLRAEIEPVAARDFLRFLFAWQHVTAANRLEGPDALAATVAQVEGFEAPPGAWESEILPSRVADYEPAWLDDECLSGRVTWARLKPHIVRPAGERGVSPCAPRRSLCSCGGTLRSGILCRRTTTRCGQAAVRRRSLCAARQLR
jgi:ATP-dependent Lhr-like helicase